MRRIIVILVIATAFVVQACNKESAGDAYDIDNSLPPYVALSDVSGNGDDTITVKQGAKRGFSFEVRTALQQTITVTYDVTGAFSVAGKTTVIPRNELSISDTVVVPANVIVPPATVAYATVKLTKAVAANGMVMTIGSKNDPAVQKYVLEIVP